MKKYKSFGDATSQQIEHVPIPDPVFINHFVEECEDENGNLQNYVRVAATSEDPNLHLDADSFKLDNIVSAGAAGMLKEVRIDTNSPLNVMDATYRTMQQFPLNQVNTSDVSSVSPSVESVDVTTSNN